MPAKSPARTGTLVVAGISGRALAAAARRAGYSPLVADLFCDTDTVAMAERTVKLPGSLSRGIEGEMVVPTLRRLVEGQAPAAIVLGSGFETKAATVEAIASNFPLAGNRSGAIGRVKDPWWLAQACARFRIPHPQVAADPPVDASGWISKRTGGAGGTHVLPAAVARPEPGRYFQRMIPGRSFSALFVADRATAHIVGFSRQWHSPTPSVPYRYGGAVRPERPSTEHARAIGLWLSQLTAEAGLVGICSADFIRNADGLHLVEINPRPGATLDIFDDADRPLMDAHLRSSRGEPFVLPEPAGAMASMIAYAREPIQSFPAVDWPGWTADRQSAGTALSAGDPVCTILARGRSAFAALGKLKKRARILRRAWEGCRT